MEFSSRDVFGVIYILSALPYDVFMSFLNVVESQVEIHLNYTMTICGDLKKKEFSLSSMVFNFGSCVTSRSRELSSC